ncbi:MAG: hypothetical protein WKG03_16720 [Telluria sp.]
MRLHHAIAVSGNQEFSNESWTDYFSIRIDETVDDPYEPPYIPPVSAAKQIMIQRELRGEFGIPNEQRHKAANKGAKHAK